MIKSSLKERVMIVNLSISQWGARKYDKNASREIEQLHNAVDAGRFNKVLIKSDTLEEIQKTAGKARSFHYEATLPWGDNGDRILSTENYFNYLKEISGLKMEFGRLVEQFVQEYKDEIERSRQRLGSLFNEQDYPHPDMIKDKFNLKPLFMPVAEADDFRINISDSMLEAMKNQIGAELNSRVERATNSIIERARETVQKMIDTLSEPGKVFRDSLVGNVEELVETIPMLNFNDDQHVKDVAEMLKSLIVDPTLLRGNDSFRQEINTKAKEILNNI